MKATFEFSLPDQILSFPNWLCAPCFLLKTTFLDLTLRRVTWARQVKRPTCRATSVVSYHWPVPMHHLRRLPMEPNIGPQVTARHPVESRHPYVRPLSFISLEHEKKTTTLPGSCGMSWTALRTWKMTCRRMQSQAVVEYRPSEQGHSRESGRSRLFVQGPRGKPSCPMPANMLPMCR